MTPEAQRIAIAEACGWRKVEIPPEAYSHCSLAPEAYTWWDGCEDTQVPNYPNDLNAMHEAEKVLTEKQAVWYLQKLSQVRLIAGEGGMIACMFDRCVFATAAQRAEAFLRTIGKWVETTPDKI